MAREESNFAAMRFITVFRALDWVRKSCFSTSLSPDWSQALDEFTKAVVDLIKDY